MNERVGFVGLGIMGQGMARNLLKAGYSVRVWNRTSSRMDPLIEAGAAAGASPADVAANCDIIAVCVSDTPDVEEVVLGKNGILSGVQAGALVIDFSTISPQATIDIAGKLSAKGVKMLDAPVSGGSEGAANGTLSIMIGGDEDQVERARGLFEAMGNTITHVGKQGAGQTVKLVNQILVVGNCLAMCEALIFAQAGGVDLERCLNAVTGGAAGSWMLANRGPQIIDRDWRPGFTINLQQKDVRLIMQEADALGVPVLLSGQVFSLYRTLQQAGLGEEGNHALVKALENLSGLQVG
ncbi:MAG: NAD(P)-dependent oxidoreductase [Caldilineaceae bacterium]|nr:NAD(P)-dependent oxidoreductase [Caldilineaceae bacterium]